jgi:hypothetical protein
MVGWNLLGLGKIFIFSVFSGLSFAFSYRTSGDSPEAGFSFVILNLLNQYGDEQIQAAVMILSIIVTIIFLYGLTVFIRQVYEQRLIGIVTALLGFFGSFVILYSTQQQTYLIFLGASFWIIGIIVVLLGKKRQTNSKL